MSKPKTVIKKRDNFGLTGIIIGSVIIFFVIGFFLSQSDLTFTTYKPGKCYVHSENPSTMSRIDGITQDRHGKSITYFFVSPNDDDKEGYKTRPKDEFSAIYKESVDCSDFEFEFDRQKQLSMHKMFDDTIDDVKKELNRCEQTLQMELKSERKKVKSHK